MTDEYLMCIKDANIDIKDVMSNLLCDKRPWRDIGRCVIRGRLWCWPRLIYHKSTISNNNVILLSYRL